MKFQDKKINFKYNIKKYGELLRNHKWVFVSLLVATLIVEGLLVADKYLFKIIIDRGTEFVTGTFQLTNFTKILIMIALVYCSIVIIRTIGSWIKVHLSMILDARIIYDLKDKYFTHIIKLSHNFHTTHKTGSLISRINRGSNAVEGMTDTLAFQFAPLLFNLIIVGVSISFFSWISAVVVIGIAVLFIGYSFLLQQIQQKHKLIYNRNMDIEKGVMSDIFSNIDSIKHFGKENYIRNFFLKLVRKTKDSSLKYEGFYRWFDAGQMLILGLGTFLLIYFPVTEFLTGKLTLGSLVFMYTVLGNIVGPMFAFVWGMRNFYRAMADLQDIFEYGKIENDIVDKNGAKNLEIHRGEIKFEDVVFNYGKSKAFCLDKFTLNVNKNQKVALVGPSGCGKTTIIKLLYRLYDVQGGRILIDGKDIRDFKQESLRSELSIVPQECILFDDTIYNNIKFANPQASRDEILKAIEFAQLDKIISTFQKKEHTIVGERGIRLSGGEKQRVSIARAILANKKILVLDEATSALDSETEHVIQESLSKLLEGRTAIIIAHRLSTIMKADKIVVIEKGKVVQEGTHNQLIRQKGRYNRLWELQKGGYIK